MKVISHNHDQFGVWHPAKSKKARRRMRSTRYPLLTGAGDKSPDPEACPVFRLVPIDLPTEKRGGDKCYHQFKGYEYDEDAERVYCRGCEAEVSPFNALVELSRNWRHYKRNIEDAEKKRRVLQADVDALKREEHNTRARLRRLSR